MRDVLQDLSDGKITIVEAEAKLLGYATSEAGRFDVAREHRRGVPECILCDRKTTEEIVTLASIALETTGRAIITRTTPEIQEAVKESLPKSVELHSYSIPRIIVAKALGFEPPVLDATIAIVTAGTSDRPIAEEAAIIASEMGASIVQIRDVGVAGLHRLLDQIEVIRSADVAIVAAGREGTLPSIVAGLVATPVIGLPVSTGYGLGGSGEAALTSMLQSCAVLTTVNIDAGFVAGAQAGMIAKSISQARTQK
jgi:NCAIR mutase (PurE)-related protein